ncbi:proteophosphoglycan 5 [Rhodotorula toruloides]|uniref:Proteophosphoglycan 5 n=1 Tax=Rhodotorula toruloides TaxID=5286 RepID=A0A511KQD2_RHOTO|nr:proteophosphoglycan 5 [Rhodotorula toruloides]
MERSAVRLEGDEGIKNEVIHIFREPIISAIKDRADRIGKPAADDDKDLEIVFTGKKRAASPGLNVSARKKANKPLFTSFSVLELDLTFPPLDGEEEGIAAALVSTKTPPGDPIILTDIVFQQARDSAKAPHRIYIRHAETNAALVELDPLDPASLTAPGWTAMIAPPPLTKSGKPFKKSYNAKKAPQNQPRPVVTTGAGGLVDALALFSQPHLGDEGVDVTSKFGIELVPGDSIRVLFHLYLDVSIRPALFYTSAYSRSKRILVDRLIPESDPLQINDDAPREANIDYFYACLRRAPRTDKGAPVASGAATLAHPPAETDEEHVARLRREAKGKQRAVEPDDAQANGLVDGEGDGREDEMFHLPGLTVQLMPFQARTVRWMIRREGKKIAPLAPLIAEDFAGGEQGHNEMDEVDGDEDFELATTSKGKGKGKVKEVEKPATMKGKGKGKKAVSPAPDTSEHPVPVLEDLDEETVKNMKRGPLWTKVTLHSLPDKAGDVMEKEVWLNRVSMRFTEIDPVDQLEFSGTATPVVKDDADGDGLELEADRSVDKPERAASSKKVVGGAEGYGLLAEEVGLGKTVEALSLILLHSDPKRHKLPSYHNPISDSDVRPSGLTLIIAPTAIVGQWETEIARLTPGLRVLRYQGTMSLYKAWDAAYVVREFDLVLTTFDVLRKEVAFARKPVQRGLRNKREIRYRRSLLVEIDFFRVMMDEAQMLGDAVGPASETASLVSRHYSWAVTSTPLRDKIADLRPLLTFLRVEPIASGTASLQRLLDETESFRRLWHEIGERTLKSQVQHELVLPAQHRYVVPVDFNAIERFHYEERYRAALRAIGLTEDGQPYRMPGEDGVSWEPDKGELLRALTLLRQLCTHPALGQANKQALGGRVLKTVEQVYAAMKQAAVHEIQSAQRALLDARVRRGQLLMWDEEVETRFDAALELYKSAIAEIDPIIDEVTKEIHDAWAARTADANRDSPADVRDNGVAGALELGFRSVEGADETELMSDRERAASTTIGALRNRLRDLLFVKHAALFFTGHAYFNSKREEEEKAAYAAAEQLRQLMTGPFEAAVERAQAILKGQLDARDAESELGISDLELQFSKTKHGLMARETFEAVATTTDLLNGYAELVFQYREMIVQMLLAQVSIAGEDATGEEYEERAVLQERLTVYLEAYTVLLGEWSYGITGTRSALADQYKAEAASYLYDQEIIGEQKAPPPKRVEDKVIDDYGDALGEALGAIAGPSRGRNADVEEEDEEGGAAEQADPREEDDEDEEADNGEGKAPAKRKKKKSGPKSRFQQKRLANKKNRSYKEFLGPTIESGHSAEQVLRYQLLVERLESKGEGNEFAEVTPIRQLIKALKEASERSESYREITILDRERARLQKSLPPLENVADRLRSELSDFTTAYNARLTYFANLQQISDDVRDPDMGSRKWRGLLVEIEFLRQDELELKASLESKLARRRYLENLNNLDAREEEETTCPICAETFSQGVLTNCGHLTCAACFRRWHTVSKNCALCKQPLPAGSYQTVSYRAKPAAAPEEANAPLGKDQCIDSQDITQSFDTVAPKLNEIDESSREKILEIQTALPLSSKSDFVAKHVKYLRRRDPDAKVVIFSVWQEALSLLIEAFTRNGIKFVRLEGAVGTGKKEGVVATFQNDPDVAAFFLHTRSQSAGLNLTAARYVFLVEPLLHSSLELQAVARVHRITQTRDTFVFQYAVTDSVDRRVADLRARQGTSLFLAGQGQDREKESRLAQQKGRPSVEARQAANTDELIDDEEDLARCILSRPHYLSLQRALFPARLRATLPPLPMELIVRAEGPGAQPAAMAGIAAAARPAVEEEEDRMDVEAGPSGT